MSLRPEASTAIRSSISAVKWRAACADTDVVGEFDMDGVPSVVGGFLPVVDTLPPGGSGACCLGVICRAIFGSSIAAVVAGFACTSTPVMQTRWQSRALQRSPQYPGNAAGVRYCLEPGPLYTGRCPCPSCLIPGPESGQSGLAPRQRWCPGRVYASQLLPG